MVSSFLRKRGWRSAAVIARSVSDSKSANYVQLYRNAIKQANSEHGVINNRFGVLRVALCAPTDDEAIALQESSYRIFNDQIAGLFAPWMDGKPPPTYEYIVEGLKKQQAIGKALTMKQLVEFGQAIIGSPETCARFLNKLADAGVDEVLLFMQGAKTPHNKILDSIRLFAEEVRPRLK